MFYTRQRTTDLLTQMAVTVQGYLALDLVKKNNVELVKGVDRASTTTVSALRTAVTVAQAMTNQKLVLEQISALNTTTAGMIDSTGELLRTQTGAIHEQAASSTIPLETLQRAFQNIYETMDQIDRFKLEALGNMKQTVETLGVRGREVEGLYRPRRRRVAGQARGPGARRSRRSRANEHRDRLNAIVERRGGHGFGGRQLRPGQQDADRPTASWARKRARRPGARRRAARTPAAELRASSAAYRASAWRSA